MKSLVESALFILVVLLSLASANTPAHNHPQRIAAQQHDSPEILQLVGKGVFRWLWLDLYEAQLSTPSGVYRPQQWPLSLELTYAREIPRTKLIQTTEQEWQRQGLPYQEHWLSELNAIWPDIAKGDQLLLFVDPQVISHFYHNGKKIGSIEDQQFASAFTAIWLSDDTLKPKLRHQLTGYE